MGPWLVVFLGELKTGVMVPNPAAGSGSLKQFVKIKATIFGAESGLPGQASEAGAAREEAAFP